MLLVGIGELLWDIYPDGRYVGGATFNFVHHVQQLGHKGLIISRIGNDLAGEELLHLLQKREFDTDFVQIDKERGTGYVVITLDENAEPSFECSPVAPYDYLEWNDALFELAPRIDAVLYGTFAQRNDDAANTTKAFLQACSKAVKVFDVNFRGWDKNMRSTVFDCLPLTDIIKMNENEFQRMKELFPELPEDAAECLPELVKRNGLQLACLTAGRWGCLISDGPRTVYCPGIKIQPVDTTGAGDAFIAALTIMYMKEAPLHHAGLFANLVAVNTIIHKGATPLYTIDAIRNIEQARYDLNVKEEWREYMTQDV